MDSGADNLNHKCKQTERAPLHGTKVLETKKNYQKWMV